ncbi:MAG: sulfatase-like hydrolase/transferase [bacterium]|nr:sulfatase-like hydrolase/transferase [bacterium]
MKVAKKVWNHFVVKQILIISGMFFSFYILDLSLRIYSNQYIGFYNWIHFAPNLFTFSWILLVIGILCLFPKKGRMIGYGVLSIISNVIVYAEYLHFSVLNRFFTFSDLLLAKEGSAYFGYAMSKTSFKMVLVIMLSIGITIITLFMMKKTEDFIRNPYYYWRWIVGTMVLVGIMRIGAISRLGSAADPLTWEASYQPKNIYLDFNNQNKSLEVSGLYELLFRSSYLYIHDHFIINKQKWKDEIDAYLEENTLEYQENDYTGILEGKNVIYVLMESIDSWLVTEEVMPTLYQLQQTGLNFTNRYAPAFGGGQTINSEFAMNTGLYAVENSKAIYNYDHNFFSTSLASKLKSHGYSAVSIHTNSGNFYNRTFFHEALGYDAHYALDDMKNINHADYNYYNDSSLVKNTETYEMIIREAPFFSFVITYSGHVPYDDTNDRCVVDPYHLKVEGNKELSCIRNLARETDEMLKILIEKLEKDQKLEDTILVLVSDHYAYGYDDQAFIQKYKGTTNSYLLQNVPFVIWNKNLKHQEIDILMDTADILPTLFNMLAIDYDPNDYIGTDVFSDYHDHFVYFSSDAFYDGETLYDGTVVDSEKQDYVNEIITTIRKKRKLNDQLILSDYFRN